ncbi:MAG: hypothetical protein LUD48_00235 [Prevotella sp.]|nr:hypothetical protein [Prevotella sp.]
MIRANNKAAKTLKMSPLIEQPWGIHRNVYGDYAGKNAYYRNAAKLRSLGYHKQGGVIKAALGSNLTSDADQNRAFLLDANSKALDEQIKGDILDNQRIQQTRELAFQQEKENAQIRNAVANKNRENIWNNRLYNKQVEASKIKKNAEVVENIGNTVANWLG